MIFVDFLPAHVPQIHGSIGLVKVISEIENDAPDYGGISVGPDAEHHVRYLFECTTFGGIRHSTPAEDYAVKQLF